MLSFSQLFLSPLSPSSRGCLVPLHFLPLKCYYLHNWGFFIFLPSVLIPACDSSSLAFCIMYSEYKLNNQDDNIQPWLTPLPILNQSFVPCPFLTVASCPAYRFLRRQVNVSCSVMYDSLQPHDCSPPGSLSIEFPKNTGVGCHSLLQGIFLAQGFNLSLFHACTPAL